jgi:ferredoxin-NADP reductase
VVEDVAHSICSFHLVPEDGKALPGFLPGQFLTFRLDIPTATGGTEQIIRCYSLSDAPRADGYRVSIKRVPAPPAVRTRAGDPRTTSTTMSRSAACCRFARRPGISISTAAMPRWC